MKVNGGAEKVTLELAKLDESCEIWVDYIDKKNFQLDNYKNKINELSKGNYISFTEHFVVPFHFLNFFEQSTNKTAIYSGSYAPLSAISSNYKKKVYYCHTPPRHWYDLKSFYKKHYGFSFQIAIALQKMLFQKAYEKSLNQMDVIVANSINVQRRIKKYLGLNSIVVTPPIDLSMYSWIKQEDYYVSLARLEDYKNVDKIISAFKKMPSKKLIVASSGSKEKELKNLAQGCKNISFTGWTSTEQLAQIIGNCIATLYMPTDEDFGMSPVESMAAGKPVIGIDDGGVKETVINEETGLLLSKSLLIDDIVKAVNLLSPKVAYSYRSKCEERAQLFSSEIFHKKMKNILDSLN